MSLLQIDSAKGGAGAAAAGVLAMPSLLPAVGRIFEAARSQDIASFELTAVRSLERLLGFDGAVWGAGVVTPGASPPLRISHACVVDRPASLLDEYGEVAGCDPVTARFLAFPGESIRIGVADYYRDRPSAAVGEYLQRHHIAQLLLADAGGAPDAPQARARRWLTAYRESPRPFADGEAAGLRALLPLWTQAHALCLARQMERMARAAAPAGDAVALCDEAGCIHAAEGGFTDLTGLREGELLGARPLPDGVIVSGALQPGPWRLLQAARRSCAELSARESDVARQFVAGLSAKQIARRLGSSPATVRTQLQAIYRKLGVHTRIDLLRALAGRAR